MTNLNWSTVIVVDFVFLITTDSEDFGLPQLDVFVFGRCERPLAGLNWGTVVVLQLEVFGNSGSKLFGWRDKRPSTGGRLNRKN